MALAGLKTKSKAGTLLMNMTRAAVTMVGEKTSSPTMSGLFLSLIASMNVISGCLCVAADEGFAFLSAKMPKLVFIRIDSDIAALLVEVDSNLLHFVRKDGSIIA